MTAGESARINLTGMRKVIAERLVSSLGPVPHFYLNIEINADALMRVRAELKSADDEDDAPRSPSTISSSKAPSSPPCASRK